MVTSSMKLHVFFQVPLISLYLMAEARPRLRCQRTPRPATPPTRLAGAELDYSHAVVYMPSSLRASRRTVAHRVNAP